MLAAGERGDPSLGGELIRSKAATTGRRIERRWRWWARLEDVYAGAEQLAVHRQQIASSGGRRSEQAATTLMAGTRLGRLIDTFPPTSAPATSRCYAKLSAAAAACWSILYFKWVAAAALHCSPPAAAAGRQEGGSLLLPALESIDLDSELLLEVQCEPAPARPGHVTLAAAERCTHPSSS